ncbi:MAG: GatB/YqeY domain-containing protein [Candidatus Pacebacteria bacterium]|nr:GatB/YqeY domain-containing protein [Candidatus Paceibacterota bacterium]MDD4074020.1 GatB/YqeY domain-containing protein [Candidatus Paceibacterota bacterium]
MILEEIKKELLSSIKERKEPNISVLRMVISAVFNKEMEKRLTLESNLSEEEIKEKIKLNDEEMEAIIFSEVKKRRDSISDFEKGGRLDLAEKEKAEIEVLMKYLPKELSEEEIREIVKEAVSKNTDIGSVMKEVVPKTKGKADGSLVAKIVKEELN